MSNKRVIAVDFDDVVVETVDPLLAHYEKTYGVVVGPEHAYGADISAWGVELDELIVRVELFHATEQRQQPRIVDGALEALSHLAKTCELHIITGRSQTLSGTTNEMIAEYFPNIFSSVHFTNLYSARPITKSSICTKLGVDLLIDDHLAHAKDVAYFDINVFLFGDYVWNRSEQLPERVRRVRGWGEVLELLRPTGE